MDGKLIYAIQRHAGLTATETAVLVALATCRNRTTGDCFPSVSTVAALAHVTPCSVKRCIRSLRDIGLLAVERFATGCGRRSRYTFADALFENQIDLHDCPVAAANELSTGGQDLHLPSDKVALAEVQGLHGEGQDLHLPSATVAHRKKSLYINTVSSDVAQAQVLTSNAMASLLAHGIPRSFIRTAIGEFAAAGWKTTRGEAVTTATLPAFIVRWWKSERNQDAYLANGGEGADAPRQAARAFTASDWILCRERCAGYRDGGCAAGVTVPPEHSPAPFPPEECRHFESAAQRKAVTA